MAIRFGMVHTRASAKYTPAALRSFLEHTRLEPGDLFTLIDNDRSFDGDLPRGPQVALSVNTSPKSFAENANAIAAQALTDGADFVFLNNDIIFTSNWLERLKPPLPVIAIPVCNQNIRYTVDGFALKEAMDLDDYMGNESKLAEIARLHQQKSYPLQQVLCAPFYCVYIPHTLLRQIGEFDEAFGKAGAEDTDYCLRAYLHGFGVFLAPNSFLLHFMGKSTWRGAESQSETQARNAAYLSRFEEKWGTKLARLAILKDRQVLTSLNALNSALYQHGAVAPAIRELARMEGKETVKRDKPKIAAVCAIYDDTRWLESTVDSIYAACDQIFFLVSTRPWNGELYDNSATLDLISKLGDPQRKIALIRGDWSSETEQRNHGLQILERQGYDYCFIVDADEIYDSQDLSAMLALAFAKRYIPAWRVGMFTYWKSEEYIIDPPETFEPVVLLQTGRSRFTDKREVDNRLTASIPRDICVCHHMSYARSDAEVQRKISTFSHVHQLVPGWYENVWKKWDDNPNMHNLHPCWPQAYKRAVRQAPDRLPPGLRKSG